MRRRKLTPQEQATENANAQARAKERAAAEAQRKLERRERCVKEVSELMEKARILSNWPLTEEGEEASKIQYVMRDIGRTWFGLHEELIERQVEFMARPANYFEWAEKDMINACKREILDSILYLLSEEGQEGQNIQPSLRLVDILSEIAERLTDALLNNEDRPTSTNVAHNATMIAKKEAQSYMLRWHLNGWLRLLKPVYKVT